MLLPCRPPPAAYSKRPLLPFVLVLAALASACLAGCAHVPENAASRPEVRLLFDRMEADTPDTLTFYLVIPISNPGKKGAAVRLAGSQAFVNGVELSGGYAIRSNSAYTAAASQEEIGAVYTLNMKNLFPPLEGGTPDIETKAVVELDFLFDGGGCSTVHAEAVYAFPRVQEPEFSIVSIAVVQAELINTRFKVRVKIRNPNPFPVTLSSFSYELYGSGYLWAGGRKKKLFDIPGNGETEDNLFLVTNFMDTHRSLLDQVIAMRNVRYRFTGEAEIGTGVSYLPNFTAGFDLNGDSEVLH
jgi:LEA14-like dessication related protein